MGRRRIGVALAPHDASEAVSWVVAAEEAGAEAVWLTTGLMRPDALTILAAAAVRTKRIELGTAVIPILPRHPLVIAQQAVAVSSLAPGRLRLGLGASTAASMEAYGLALRAPLGHLFEYLTVLRTLFRTGEVEFSGEHVQVRGEIGGPVEIPVLGSALQERAFELCGEAADGAITWVCPIDYVREVGVPALARGAAKADRSVPELVIHVPVVVSTDPSEIRASAQRDLGQYPKWEFYRNMFAHAGFPHQPETLSERLVDALVVSGDEAAVAGQLLELSTFGEVMAMPLADRGRDRIVMTQALAAIGLAASTPA